MLQLVVFLQEVSQITGNSLGRRAESSRARDDAHLCGNREPVEYLLEPLALGVVADLLRNAARGGAGHHDKIAAWDGKVSRHTRPLRRDRILCHLHGDGRSGLEHLVDLLVREAVGTALLLALAAFTPPAFAFAALRGPIVLVILIVGVVQLLEERFRVWCHVPVVEERVLL